METVAVKLGGSVITDKQRPFTARGDMIARLVSELKAAMGETKLIVGNGGGSFPHQPASEGRLKEGITENSQLLYMARTQDAASRLNRLVVAEFLRQGVPAFSMQPSAMGLCENGKVKAFETGHIQKLLDMGVVPVVYGDVFADTKKGCSILSTEEVINSLSLDLEIDRIVIGTNVEGVLDGQGKLIPEITKENFAEIKKHLGGSKHTDVTGGMLHKVEEMLKVRPDVLIINALTPGNVKKAVLGESIGTLIR